jgi:hypothetical protein
MPRLRRGFHTNLINHCFSEITGKARRFHLSRLRRNCGSADTEQFPLIAVLQKSLAKPDDFIYRDSVDKKLIQIMIFSRNHWQSQMISFCLKDSKVIKKNSLIQLSATFSPASVGRRKFGFLHPNLIKINTEFLKKNFRKPILCQYQMMIKNINVLA